MSTAIIFGSSSSIRWHLEQHLILILQHIFCYIKHTFELIESILLCNLSAAQLTAAAMGMLERGDKLSHTQLLPRQKPFSLDQQNKV